MSVHQYGGSSGAGSGEVSSTVAGCTTMVQAAAAAVRYLHFYAKYQQQQQQQQQCTYATYGTGRNFSGVEKSPVEF